MLEEMYDTVVGAAYACVNPRERRSIHWQRLASAAMGFDYAFLGFLPGPATIELTAFEINVIRDQRDCRRLPCRGLQSASRPCTPALSELAAAHLDQPGAAPDRPLPRARALRPEHGFIFAFRDWAAGTLVSPRCHMQIQFGLGTHADGTWRGVRTLYFRPFVGLAQWLRDRAARLQLRSEK